MGESQKETSSVGQPKKKNSVLDLDFDKDDFLSSWNKISVTDNDTMDLDFGPISKGKKNAFSFDKSDIDFNLDSDFGKIPSFNLDIPDIDISSPVKKDGKRKESSREESTDGNTRGKANHFDFTFDFNDLDGFSFKSRSKKENVMVKGGEAREDSSNRMLSQKSNDCLAEDVDTHQSESRNPQATGSLITSKPGLQGYAGCSPESSNASSPSKSAKHDVDQLNYEASIDEEASAKAMTLVKKTASGGNDQELNIQLDQSMSQKLLSQDVCIANENVLHKSLHSVLRSESSRDTVPEVLEEASFRDTEACNMEKSANKKLKDDHCEIPLWSGSSGHDTATLEKKKARSQDETDNDALVAVKEGAEPVQSATPVEKLSSAHASTELVPKAQVYVKNQGELLSTLNSRPTANDLMPEKERESATRSKYFKQPDKGESQFQNASKQATCSSISDRAISTRQLCPSDGSQKHNSIAGESDTKLAGISLSHSDSVIGKENSQIRSWESCRGLKTNRPLGEDVMKGKPVASTGGDKNVRSLHSFGAPINSSSGLTIKSSSQKSANSAGLAMNVETCHNRKSNAGAGDKLFSAKAIKQMPPLSSPTTSRASAANLDLSKSPAHKDTMLSRDLQQPRILARSTLSETIELAVPKKQMPTPPSLKRKYDEVHSTDLILKPLKRLSESPRTMSGKSTETSGKTVDSKACEREKVVEEKSKNGCKNQNNSNLNAPNQVGMNEVEVLSSLDYNSNIEMAEACSKGLDDMCNLLSKKHEEAKELLVRAVVNNNRLLMLNHPIYEEKIRMLQKFAAQLTLREIHP